MALQRGSHWWAAILAVLAAACAPTTAESGEGRPLRIRYNPYSEVDWTTTRRLKTQLHDHVGASRHGLQAYDSAGYQVMSLMNYSGAPDLPYAWRERRWPPDGWVASDVLATFRNIELLIPNGEEVGTLHTTSPFLTEYVESAVPELSTAPPSHQYHSLQEAVNLVNALGGLSFLAHPWGGEPLFNQVNGIRGVEIYSAYLREGDRAAGWSRDRNAELIRLWDQRLRSNQRIWGIAVNDHYGPDRPDSVTTLNTRDSGKIIIFAPDASPASVRHALETGAFVAIRDLGTIKDQYLGLSGMSVTDTSVTLATLGAVRWIVDGQVVRTGPTATMSQLPSWARFLRAEIRSPDGSLIYLQPFTIRQRDDANGDGAVNQADLDLCEAVSNGTETDPDFVAACQAIPLGSSPGDPDLVSP